MAKTYLDIQNSAYTVGNIMDWTNALTRLSGVPVDITEVYDSYDKAVEYAATNPVAYEGQLITVTEAGDTTVYVITPAVQGTHVVGEGEEAVTYNVNIKKVGTVPSGDNASITVTEAGLVSIFGFAGAQDGMLPIREDGKLVWKTLEAIGAGDGNDNTTYDFALTESKAGIIVTPYFNGQPIMEGEEGAQVQKKFELVLDVYTKAEADEKFLAKSDYAPYDDTSLTNRVSVVETVLNGTEASEGVEATEGLVDKVAANTQAISDEVSARETAITNITKAETGAIAVAVAAEAEARDEAIKVVDDKIGDVAEGSTVVDMISAVEDKIPSVPTAVSAFTNDAGYLVAADIADKADKADTLAGYGIGDAYTKTEVDTAIDNAKKSILGDGVEEAYNTLKEIQDILQGTDGEAIDGLVETVDANKNAIATLNGDVNTAGSVDKKIADAVAPLATADALDAVRTTAEAAQTATQVASAIETALDEANLDQYAIGSEVEAELDLKANAADVVSNTTFEEFKEANTTAIGTARTGAVEDVSKVGYALAEDVAKTYATQQSVTDLSNTVTATLTDYAKTADVDTKLAKKIESATINHANDETSEGATVSGTVLNIVVDAPTRAETAQMIADSIKDVAGEDSIPAVKADLGAEITRSTNKDTAHDNAIAALQTAVGEAKAQADKGVADAKTANDAIAALTNGAVATNTSDITTIKGRLDTLETAKGDHAQRLTTAESKIAALEAADVVINETLGTINGNITTLTNKDAELAGLIQANTNKFADYSTTTQMNAAIEAAITGAELGTYAKKADLEAIYKAGEGETAATGILAVEIERAKAAEKANADAIAILNGYVDADNVGDTGKSVRTIVAEETAKIVNENNNGSIDTLNEIAAWIINDTTGAASMANDIAALKGAVDTGDQKVSEYVAAAIAAIPVATTETAGIVKASEEVTVAADGKLGIGKVSTDALVQGEDTLIINGGAAN